MEHLSFCSNRNNGAVFTLLHRGRQKVAMKTAEETLMGKLMQKVQRWEIRALKVSLII